MAGSILGNNVRRVENPRFITGRGRFMEHLEAENALDLRPVRSRIPHGALNEVHTDDAKAVPGVVVVLTASFEVAHTVTPTPLNQMGVKGIGEAAMVRSTPAIQNAVMDSPSHQGIEHLDMPFTAPRVWKAIRGARPSWSVAP